MEQVPVDWADQWPTVGGDRSQDQQAHPLQAGAELNGSQPALRGEDAAQMGTAMSGTVVQ
jgi:hypothetical protein